MARTMLALANGVRDGQGGTNMNRKVLSGVLAGIGMLALSTTAAQAGSGGGVPSALTSFFVCKTINGDSAARTVDVQASNAGGTPAAGWGFQLRGVLLGNAILACAFAKLFDPPTLPGQQEFSDELAIDPNPDPNPLKKFLDLKCYAISVPRSQVQTGAPQRYDVTDNLFPGGLDQDVPGSSLQYICAPATFKPIQ